MNYFKYMQSSLNSWEARTKNADYIWMPYVPMVITPTIFSKDFKEKLK